MKRSLENRKLMGGFTVSLLILVLLAWTVRKFSAAPSAPELRAGVVQSAYHVGQELRYALDYRGRSGDEVRLKGELHLVLLGREKDAWRVWARIGSIKAKETELPPLWRKQLLPSLQRGAPLLLASSGFQLTSAGASQTMASSFWSSLGELARVSLHGERESFHVQEMIDQMEADAHYQLVSSAPQAEQWVKTYQLRHAQASGEGQATIDWVSGSAPLRELKAHRRLEMAFQDRKLRSESELSLVLLSDSLLTREEQDEWEALARVPVREPTQMELIQTQALGTSDWAQLRAQMQALAGKTPWPQDLYLKVKAWIFLHPNDLSAVREPLRVAAADSSEFKGLVKALTAAAHPEAQALLAAILDERGGEEEAGERLVMSLGLVAGPTLATQRTLERLAASASPLARGAKLSLGIVGNRLKRTDPARATAIEEALWKSLREGNREEQVGALSALGNLGPSRIDELEPFLQSPESELRGQAYYALRFSNHPQLAQRWAQAYRSESDQAARERILAGLSLREPDALWLASVEALVSSPLQAASIQSLARLILRHAASYPEASLRLLSALEAQAAEPALKSLIVSWGDMARSKLKGS